MEEDGKKPQHSGADDHHGHHKKDKHSQSHAEAETVSPDESEPVDHPAQASGHPAHRLKQWSINNKRLAVPGAIALLLVILFVVPFTRYTVLGLFLKQDFSIVVVDTQTGRPVSSAEISLKGRTTTTDGQGKASLRVPVGEGKLTISKTYYQSLSREVVVPIRKSDAALNVELRATGRAVAVTVLNTISKKAVAGATLTVGDSKVKTDPKGQAVLILPTVRQAHKGQLVAAGYNPSEITVDAVNQAKLANQFMITPAGKVYFLSDQSGKLDVVKTDLDGTNRQTVLAGTGKESKEETILLATRDWEYLALQSRRDGGNSPKLFLIKTVDGSLTTMDEGDASFTLSGWEGHQFIYVVNRNNVQEWEAKKQALKVYNADDKKLKTLDQTTGEGSNIYDFRREFLNDVYVVGGKVVYLKSWTGGYYTWGSNVGGKQATLNSVKPDGNDKQVVKTFDVANNVNIRSYAPGELYIRAVDKFFEYEDGKVKDLANMDDQKFFNSEYPTYLLSPGGHQTFWSISRDGKRNLMVGNTDGKQEKQVARLSDEHQVYGWLTDEYLLVSKKSSELFVMPVGGIEQEDQLLKITDYYKPIYSYFGYGGGYGGL